MLLARGDRSGAQRGFRRRAERGDLDAMFQLGTLLAEDGDPQGLQWLEEAHRVAPEEASIRNNLGHALREAGRLDEAAGLFRASVTHDPSDEVRRRYRRAELGAGLTDKVCAVDNPRTVRDIGNFVVENLARIIIGRDRV